MNRIGYAALTTLLVLYLLMFHELFLCGEVYCSGAQLAHVGELV